MTSVADEVAALRGTRAATFKDLLTHPAFSRLLAAMTISSLGDWVGFIAVTSLVTRLSGSTAAAGLAVGAVMTARLLPVGAVRSVRRGARRPHRPQADHDHSPTSAEP